LSHFLHTCCFLPGLILPSLILLSLILPSLILPSLILQHPGDPPQFDDQLAALPSSYASDVCHVC